IPKYRNTLAGAYDQRAELFATQNGHAEAAEAYGKALILREQLVRDNPANFDWRIELGVTQVRLGLATLEMQLGNAAYGIRFFLTAQPKERLMQALDCYDRAIDNLSEVVKRDTRNPTAQRWLCHAYQWRGVALQAWNDPWGATADFTEALRLAEEKD